MRARPEDLCPLADSLPATIRWRFTDYQELLTKQLKLLAAVSQARPDPRTMAKHSFSEGPVNPLRLIPLGPAPAPRRSRADGCRTRRV